jgi:hypothetical protein
MQPPPVIRDRVSFVVANFVPGVVLRAFHNGTEAAVKRPKIKVTLNPRELKKFTQEVMTMLKASDVFCQLRRLLTCRPGQPPSLCANIQRELESGRPLHRYGVDGRRQLVRRAGRGPFPSRVSAHQGSARNGQRPRLPAPPVDRHHPRRHQGPQRSARARRQLQGARSRPRRPITANCSFNFSCATLVALLLLWPPAQ